jgi:single-strand DNA-binding protein
MPKDRGGTGGVNVAVVVGELARPAVVRPLPSGSTVVVLEVTVSRKDGPAETVPVVWFDAPAGAGTLDAGDAVVVVGRVRRRFFRVAGATQSRTEVVADRVVEERHRARARRALEEARAALQRDLLDPPATSGQEATRRSGTAGGRISV